MPNPILTLIREQEKVFQGERTRALSDMFDNCGADGIYPTTQFYNRIDKACRATIIAVLTELDIEIGVMINTVDYGGKYEPVFFDARNSGLEQVRDHLAEAIKELGE